MTVYYGDDLRMTFYNDISQSIRTRILFILSFETEIMVPKNSSHNYKEQWYSKVRGVSNFGSEKCLKCAHCPTKFYDCIFQSISISLILSIPPNTKEIMVPCYNLGWIWTSDSVRQRVSKVYCIENMNGRDNR